MGANLLFTLMIGESATIVSHTMTLYFIYSRYRVQSRALAAMTKVQIV